MQKVLGFIKGNSDKTEYLPTDIAKHNKDDDLWIIIDNKVYNVSEYQKTHPGGAEVLRNVGGKEASKQFKDANHSETAIKKMAKYYVGDVAKLTEREQLIMQEFQKSQAELEKIKKAIQKEGSWKLKDKDLGEALDDIEDVNEMWCMQCQQTTNNVACQSMGVCGKNPKVSALQDLILYCVKGIAQYGDRLGISEVPHIIQDFVLTTTFATLTNVNYDENQFFQYLKEATQYRNILREKYKAKFGPEDEDLKKGPASFDFSEKESNIIKLAKAISVKQRKQALNDDDLFSLIEMCQYGMKGVAAYMFHAESFRKKHGDKVFTEKEKFEVLGEIFRILRVISEPFYFNIEALLKANLDLGKCNIQVMDLLDRSHNRILGSPSPKEYRTVPIVGKCLLVSGHDLIDLLEILEQTKGLGINVYTHGEMLPAHAYPELNKFSHLTGNFGGAWYMQQSDFEKFPGPIVFTSNCIMPPKDCYFKNLFTKNAAGWPGVTHLHGNDYEKPIEQALKGKGFTQEMIDKFPKAQNETVGFAHNAVLSIADKVIDAVKDGQLKHIFLIGGCDNAGDQRRYYRDMAVKSPKESLIMTLGCLRFRLRGLNLGNLGNTGIPRFLDVGQCNDSYSAVKIALALADAFKTDVNSLPLHLCLAWFEQKAVAILLSLLYLGIKNIRIGPNLPAFLTGNVVKVLQDKFNLMLASSADEDMKTIVQ